MRKILFSFFAILLISSQSLVAAGYIATYSMKVSNPAAYIEAMNELMSSKWGKSFPAEVSVHSYAFNGYDDATHVVVLNYEDVESTGKGTASFTDPTFQKFLAKTAPIAETIESSLNMKLMGGGNSDPENNQVYTVYRMKVKDPASYAKAYAEVTKAQEEAGNVAGSYGLRQQVGGSVGWYTHYAFTSAGSMTEALESGEALYSSDSFKEFSKEIGGNRELVNISMLVNVVTYSSN